MQKTLLTLALIFALTSCATLEKMGITKEEADAPLNTDNRIQKQRGKLTGEGFNLLGGDKDDGTSGATLGVNSFLWRATLDTLAFMPFASADPFGGVIITDWYEDPKTPGERFKVNAIIMDTGLRADAIKIKLFKQQQQADGQWKDIEVHPKLPRKLEDTILTRARELRVNVVARSTSE
jgi:hypothetical protein